MSQQCINAGNVFSQETALYKGCFTAQAIFRESSTNESWKGEVLCWKTDYGLDGVVDLSTEALDWDLDEFCFVSEKKIRLCISSC